MQVTKQKHPGRIAAGKKLAEFNRQKKLNKLAKEKLVKGEEEQQVKTSNYTVVVKEDQSDLKYKIAGAVVLVAGIGWFASKFLYKQHTCPKAKQQTKQQTELEEVNIKTNKQVTSKSSNPDPFIMQ